jgi:hypothetical protein
VLWQVYFRLELKYAADVRLRNEVLGVPDVAAGSAPGRRSRRLSSRRRGRVHPFDRVFHAQFVYIAAKYDWANELTENMTKALTREFRERGADADASLYENLLSSLGNPGDDDGSASCGALACRATEDAIARGGGFCTDGRVLNLLAFTREAFDLDAKETGPREARKSARLDRLGVAAKTRARLCSPRSRRVRRSVSTGSTRRRW